MKVDKTTIIKNAVDNLIEMFRNGTFPEKVALSIISRNENDMRPCDSWTSANRLLAMLQGAEGGDARGYKQWLSIGRHVKHGEKAIYIIAPLTKTITEKDKNTGEDTKRVILTGFRPIAVFAESQTEGDPLPQYDYRPAKYPNFYSVAAKLGISVSYKPISSTALGSFSVSRNTISLSSYDEIVFLHELSHGVHSTFVDLTTYDRDKAEIVAEVAALTLAYLCGVNKGYEFQAYEYVKEYSHDSNPEGVLKKIMGVLTDVEKIVQIVLDNADQEEVTTPEVANESLFTPVKEEFVGITSLF